MNNDTVNELLEDAFFRYSDNIALKYKDKSISYKELNDLSNKKANYLKSKGVKTEDFVGIVLEHSIDLIVNIMAVLKTGAAYIPMEHTFPKNRINYIIEQAPIKYLITKEKYYDKINNKSIIVDNDVDLTNCSKEKPEVNINGSNAIYALYTSGSTGNPKGVVVEQHNVSNYVKAFRKEFNVNEQDKMLQNSVVTFDIFTEELFPILCNGGTLVIIEEEKENNAKEILNLVKKENISFISAFPYLISDINKLVEKGESFPKSLRITISGGDTLRKEHCNCIINKTKVYNTYGPTETTVVCSYYHYTDKDVDSKTVPIGKSIYGTEMLVLDEKLNKVQPGEIGEICITGNGVSRGYLHLDEETKNNFIINPFNPKERMYLSGDLGLLKEDGNIEFIKRKDQQVMIQGRRVEPSEVENVLYKFTPINRAIVKPYQDQDGYSFLVGYIQMEQQTPLKEIKRHLLQYVPDYMVPEYFVKVDSFNVTLNGKIDRKGLPIILK